MKLAVKMLLEWPPKTRFVPLGLLRVASLHPSGLAWLADTSNSSNSIDALLEHVATLVETATSPSPLVAVSALLFLVNAFSTQDAVMATAMCQAITTPRARGGLRRLLLAVFAPTSGAAGAGGAGGAGAGAGAGAVTADLVNHCCTLCINLARMLEAAAGVGHHGGGDAAAVARQEPSARLAAARTVSAVLVPVLLEFAADVAKDDDHRRQACRALCNLAASGIVDKQAFQFWASLGQVLLPGDGGLFEGDDAARAEIECILRYREPIFEAY